MFKKNGKLVAGLLLSTGLLVACSGDLVHQSHQQELLNQKLQRG